MPRSNLEAKIAQLQKEIERRSKDLLEEMAHLPSSTGPKVREVYEKRAQLLALRMQRLGEMLEAIRGQRQKSTQSKARVRRSRKPGR